jgi:formate hydrogenlyase subunit 4
MIVLQIAVICAAAPLLQGGMKSLRAKLAGRPGPSITQPYRELAKLLKKETVLAEGMSPLATLAPGLVLGIAVVFAAAIQFWGNPLNSFVDIIALAMLLALGRFVLVLVALDSRSAFAGMAASREMTFAALVEPALILGVLGGAESAGIAPLLSAAAIIVVILVETARVPIDNQETHYELTMIHEGLVLEYSGPLLAILQYAAQIRQLCFFLLAALLLPGSGWLVHLIWVPVLAIGITLTETMFAKVRLFEVPQLLTAALILSIMGLLLRIGALPL